MSIGMILSLIANTPAVIAPMHLACSLTLQYGDLPVIIVVDEQFSMAFIALPTTGRKVIRRAQFSPGKIEIPDGEMTWYIDRANVSFRREFNVEDTPVSDEGQCALAPKQAEPS